MGLAAAGTHTYKFRFDRPFPPYSGGKHTRWIKPWMEIIILLSVSTIWTNNFILPEGW